MLSAFHEMLHRFYSGYFFLGQKYVKRLLSLGDHQPLHYWHAVRNSWLLTCSSLVLTQRNVNTLIEMKLEKHKNLREESGFYWREISDGSLKFDRREREVCGLILTDGKLIVTIHKT